MAAYVLHIAVIYALVGSTNLPMMLTTLTGTTMASLLLVRNITGAYIEAAEKFKPGEWLDAAQDTVIVAVFGETVVGTVVVRGDGKKGNKKGKGGTAVIRAWTTRLRERRKGVGRGLLEEAVKSARKKGMEIAFEEDGICKIFFLISATLDLGQLTCVVTQIR
jgi:hypothetical protein